MTKMKIAALFASAAMIALPGVAGAASADDMAARASVINRYDGECQNLNTVAQASYCLSGVYTYAISMGYWGVWREVERNRSAIDVYKLTDEQRRYFESPGLYQKECMPIVPTYKEGQAPEEYLRHAGFCLALATDTADVSGIDYDKENAAHLLSMIRRLKRYDTPTAP